ncbi:MAG: energy-coupling factor transporter ATPase [bacterium]
MGIRFRSVSFSYPGFGKGFYEALRNVTLEIRTTGEFIALVGQTGSGKSTLAQHMNALVFPTSGSVEIFGKTIGPKRDKRIKYNDLRRKVGLVFQFPEYQLFEETVEKDIMFGPRNFKIPEDKAREMARTALQLVGLGPQYLTRNPLNLSGGEKKRVSIAGILAMNPEVLVLDEPTSGLDPSGKKAMMELFRSIREQTDKTIIVITHDMDLVYEYMDRVLVLDNGALVFDGSPDRLFRRNDLETLHLDYPATIKTLTTVSARLGMVLDVHQKDVAGAVRELRKAVRP